MTLDVSIIIVSWNTKELLIDCLSSIEGNVTGVNYEVIVVDNASTDGSQEAVEEKFPNVKLIKSEKNNGFSVGNNIGLSQSNGRYLYLVNSDVIIKKECVKNLFDFMEQNRQVGMAGPKVYRYNGNLQPTCKRLPTLGRFLFQALRLNDLFPKVGAFSEIHLNYAESDEVKTDVEILNGTFWVVKREAFDQVGGLDDRFFMYGEDIDWSKRFIDMGWQLAFVPNAEAIHVGRASSSNDPVRFLVEREKSQVLYWKKYKGLYGVICCRLIIFIHHLFRVIPRCVQYLIKPSLREKIGLEIRCNTACLLWSLKLKK